jgi:cobalt-zinc-cadmium efflux system protein
VNVHEDHDSHGGEPARPGRALAFGLVLTLGFAAIEVGAGTLSGSLALISDAAHMVVDSAGLVLALLATLVARRPSDLRRTYGYARVEVLVVPLHVLLMLGVAAYIVYEAIARLNGSPEIQGWPVFIVGGIGLAINLVVMRLLSAHSHANLNARGAMFEVMADALGSIGVMVSAVVLITTGWAPIDVLISLAIAALVVPRALSLLRQAVSILLEATPAGFDPAEMERDVASVEGVVAVHDVHIWSLAPSFVAMSAHIELERMQGCEQQLTEVTALLRTKWEVSHVTLQPETGELHDAIECCDLPDARAEPLTRLHPATPTRPNLEVHP